MPRRSRFLEDSESVNIYQAFTDLMSNAFMILSLLLLIALFQALVVNKKLEEEGNRCRELKNNCDQIIANNDKLKGEIDNLRGENDNLRRENNNLRRKNNQLAEKNESLKSALPIIIDEKSGNYQFETGSAELPEELGKYLSNTVATDIKNILNQRDIDFIQIIGHTDGQPVNSRGNLDTILEEVANGNTPVSQLEAGSNTDLGLMRALAVVQELQKEDSLKNVEFRAYSAGQLYLTDGKLAPLNRNPNASRRRIEIRFIPPGEQQ